MLVADLAARAKRSMRPLMFQKLTARVSFNALRAFEAMGRTGQATAAGAELGTSHSAVSRQVKALEARLGVRLFEGPRHDLRLTVAGRDLLAALTDGFDAIELAVLKTQAGAQALVVAAHPSVAAKWLTPRLACFLSRRPAVRLEIVELPNKALTMRGAHAALRMVDPEHLARPDVTGFMDVHIGPVMAPGQNPATAPQLHAATDIGAFARWAELTGGVVPDAPARRLPHLHLVLDAAIAGLGTAMLPWPLVEADVRAGRLEVAGRFVKDRGAFALIADPRAETALGRAFRAWLVEEGAASPPAP
jgi:LysR family glycine cleavage system transcriptional activator